MILCKEIQAVGLPYGQLITKLLASFNFDIMDEIKDSTNHMITYIALKQI